MLTINDFYTQDLEKEPIYIFFYPTSNPTLINDERFFVNKTKFMIDDAYITPVYETYQMDIPFRYLSSLGPKSKVHLTIKPDPLLVEHWNKKLGRKFEFEYTDLSQEAPYVTLFPLERLRDKQHAVDPHVHYKVYSKDFIQTIDCPQPTIYTELQLPAMLKTYRGAGAETVWRIYTKADYDKWTRYVEETMPHTGVILMELIPDLKHDHCVQVYINKKGEWTWIGATEKSFRADGSLCAAMFDLKDQDMIRSKFECSIKAVVKALHDNNYFGWCGIDILEDALGKHYVTDLNTRMCGSSAMLLQLRGLEARGWSCALHVMSMSSAKSLADIIAIVETISGGEVIVHAAYRKDDLTVCQLAIYSTGKEACTKLAKTLIHDSEL